MKSAPPVCQTGIIDSHAHVMKEYFPDDQEQVIERAQELNVRQIVNPACKVEDFDELEKLIKKFDFLYGALGQHPHDAKDWQNSFSEKIEEALKTDKFVAVGECGLDFYYHNSEKAKQIAVFKEQVQIAKKVEKPIIVHCRDAWEESLEILESEKDEKLTGVFHCFTGGPELIERIKELDFYVSYSGIVTFKNAVEIQKSAPLVPEDRILVETDCPYLAPQAMRGKRNEPSFVWWTAQCLAQLRSTDLENIARLCTENAQNLFRLPSLK